MAMNGLVYAYSIYLDNMARHWDALVMGDYERVMPLTWNKKYGIHYLYQPSFTASLGIFGKELNSGVVGSFLSAIPSKFRLVEISLNSGNSLPPTCLSPEIRNNHILPLSKSYDALYKDYRDNIRRNIKKAQQLGVRYESDIPVAGVLELAKQQMQKISGISDADYANFEHLFGALRKKKQAIACGVYLLDQLVASAVYFFSHNRAYYILVGNHPNGKTVGASHYLIDRFIHDHAGEDIILDFEGSDIRNLAFFYNSFGSIVETYPFIRINKLPWWARLFKS
jgi:hypothetical protein